MSSNESNRLGTMVHTIVNELVNHYGKKLDRPVIDEITRNLTIEMCQGPTALAFSGKELLGERQEPVAEFGTDCIFNLRKQPNGERWPIGTKLYTSPPAPVAMVLPERKIAFVEDGALDNARKRGYNACIDDTKELNQ